MLQHYAAKRPDVESWGVSALVTYLEAARPRTSEPRLRHAGSCGSMVWDHLDVFSPGSFSYDEKAPPGGRVELQLADCT
jgi:hypothetical protein